MKNDHLKLEKEKQPTPLEGEKYYLSVRALAFDLLTPLWFFLGVLLLFLTPFSGVAFTATILSPIVGVVLGIHALCQGKEKIGKKGVIVALISVLLPIITAAVLVYLYQSGVAVISLM
ncbi:MAG: hypothetical protein J6S22_04045 [Clostridia bacterium]|nr:hypothetical protein [Clostridia bacterium]